MKQMRWILTLLLFTLSLPSIAQKAERVCTSYDVESYQYGGLLQRTKRRGSCLNYATFQVYPGQKLVKSCIHYQEEKYDCGRGVLRKCKRNAFCTQYAYNVVGNPLAQTKDTKTNSPTPKVAPLLSFSEAQKSWNGGKIGSLASSGHALQLSFLGASLRDPSLKNATALSSGETLPLRLSFSEDLKSGEATLGAHHTSSLEFHRDPQTGELLDVSFKIDATTPNASLSALRPTFVNQKTLSDLIQYELTCRKTEIDLLSSYLTCKVDILEAPAHGGLFANLVDYYRSNQVAISRSAENYLTLNAWMLSLDEILKNGNEEIAYLYFR